jgi:Ca2+ transporting ATPase
VFWELSFSKVHLFFNLGPEILGIPSSIGVNDWNEETGKHYSIFFNVFVLLQIFNEINARKLKHSEANVFENFLNNPLFLVILVSTIVIQLTMVKYGGKSLKTVELSFKENLLCIILGTFSLIAGLLIKTFLPENLIVSPKGIEIGAFSYYWNKSKDEKEE